MTVLSDRGRRTETVRAELLDTHLNVIGQLTMLSPPTVTADVTRKVPRQLSGLTLPSSDDVNPYRDRVRPVWTVGGVDYPQGVFLFQQANRTRRPWGLEVDGASLVDLTFQLDQPTGQAWGISQGQTVTDRLKDLADDAGLPDTAVIPLALTASSPLAWPAGTSRATIANHLATLVGCVQYFDRDGTWVVRPVPDPDLDVPAAHYDDGTVIVADSIAEIDDLWEQPNRWIAISTTSGDAPIVGVYDLPDSAPNSAANRGFISATVVQADGASSSSAAETIARQRARSAQVTETVTLTTTANPVHDLWDTVVYRGVPHLQVGWSLPVESGATMGHSLRRTRT